MHPQIDKEGRFYIQVPFYNGAVIGYITPDLIRELQFGVVNGMIEDTDFEKNVLEAAREHMKDVTGNGYIEFYVEDITYDEGDYDEYGRCEYPPGFDYELVFTEIVYT